MGAGQNRKQRRRLRVQYSHQQQRKVRDTIDARQKVSTTNDCFQEHHTSNFEIFGQKPEINKTLNSKILRLF
jgi:hypothetical protein